MKNVRMAMVVTVNAEMEMALNSLVAEKEFKLKNNLELDWEEEERIDRKLREWLRTHDSSDPEYSDIFKEVYGFRPR